MKKIISLALALMIICSTFIISSAEETGTITINGVSDQNVYEVYELLELTGYNVSGNYSYKVTEKWRPFFATPEAQVYLTHDSGYFVSNWLVADDDNTMAEFTKLALKYAKEHGIAPEKSSKNVGQFVITGTSGVFSGLDLGWYLVDSTAGSLCGLTTTDPHASVNAKNLVPTIDKQVQEDLTGMWGDVNTADIGQIVNFMTIIHVAAGAENYILHDKMDNGFKFVQNTSEGRGVTEIKHVNSKGVETTLTLGTDYTISTSATDGCDFEVVFDDAFVDELKANDRILVYYNAMLNRFAEVGPTGNNKNITKLQFGESHDGIDYFSNEDFTTTHTFSIDIVKTDSSNKLIETAEFRIYDAATGGTEIKVVPLLENDDSTPIVDENNNPIYRRARADEEGENIVVADGLVTIVGFDNGVYYLEEKVAPEGFHLLTTRKEFTIADANLEATFNDGVYSSGSGVHVVNKTGTMLPETGAAGTILFTSIGVIIALATGVLLVTKKRMSMIED